MDQVRTCRHLSGNDHVPFVPPPQGAFLVFDAWVKLKQNFEQEPSAPGQELPACEDCTGTRFRTPLVLYIFYVGELIPEKDFIRQQMELGDQEPWATFDDYTNWLAAERQGFKTSNYVFLLWWLAVFRGLL